ncbi:MAG: hypothetical protein OH319_01540 [Candidatus Parvarchaeota archaeon]|nr:hypothetical protein [Candidatus Jingweiarchaeum tengchongense]MCW1297746.1 hypothetical protein [Candidatus Jingweiarchaeum tengchongense]MCW1299756.1 hypothetical protein [Candidatus Jingweiarchaeum tengchongense]MCW1304273.1 hypothetical protein [Candidatus Jingweiarchaeum tengchongense]MCW1305301.1 hypothetical protein [Candidatus Jingweiarchaeum tengchongense]
MKKGVLLPALALLIFAAIMLFVALALGMMIARMVFSDSLPGALFAMELANIYNLLYTVPGNVEFIYPGNVMCKWNATGQFYRCGNTGNVTGILRTYHSEYYNMSGDIRKDLVFYLTFINLTYKLTAMNPYSIPAIYHPSMSDGCFLTYTYNQKNTGSFLSEAIIKALEAAGLPTYGAQNNLFKDLGFDNKTGIFTYTKIRYHSDTLCPPGSSPGLDHLIDNILTICVNNRTGINYIEIFLNAGQAINKKDSTTICEYILPIEANFYTHWNLAKEKYCFDLNKFSNSNTSCNGYIFLMGDMVMPYYEGRPWWDFTAWGWDDPDGKKRPVYVKCTVKIVNTGNKIIAMEREGECEYVTACNIGVKC